MKDKIMELRHLCFSYEEGKKALEDVCVSIGRGEKIAVLGSNGAGKSTFFLNLNGVRKPDSGEIYLNGKLVDRKEQKKLCRKVGIVFQDADDQIIGSTVKADVAFGPLNMGMKREVAGERADAAIARMNLSGYELRPPHCLSGGEKKRVSIAGILATEPEIILFDEPASSLDPVNASHLEQILELLSAAGKTVLVSTHDIDFAYRFAERILVFADGRLIGDGAPEEIFGQEELLCAANLRKPMMMEVCGLLKKKGILGERAACRDVRELERAIT